MQFTSLNGMYGPAKKAIGETGGASDTYWDNVTLLIQSNNEPDGSTNFVDYSSYAHTVNTTKGAPTHSTAQAIFGSSSIDLYTSKAIGAVDTDSIFEGDFTVEAWFYCVGLPSSGNAFSYLLFSNAAKTYFYPAPTRGYWINNVKYIAGVPVLPAEQWSHLALTREGSTLRHFINGVQLATGTYAGSANFTNMNLGRYVPNDNAAFNGYVDQFRMTKDVARYTEDFTPPTQAFPTS